MIFFLKNKNMTSQNTNEYETMGPHLNIPSMDDLAVIKVSIRKDINLSEEERTAAIKELENVINKNKFDFVVRDSDDEFYIFCNNDGFIPSNVKMSDINITRDKYEINLLDYYDLNKDLQIMFKSFYGIEWIKNNHIGYERVYKKRYVMNSIHLKNIFVCECIGDIHVDSCFIDIYINDC